MLVDGISLIEGSNITNLTVASGGSFPAQPDTGELFYKTTGDIGLYVYDGSTWKLSGATLPSVITATSVGGASMVPVLSIAASGLVTSASNVNIQIAETQITDGTLLARLAGNEVISGTWMFNNAVTGATPTLAAHLATKSYVDDTVAAVGPTLSLTASQITTGTFADGRISQSSVTQHQAAIAPLISISAAQTTSGTFADGRISQSSVTQHQAALTVAETQITDGVLLARVGANETITGSWQYNNPLLVGTPVSGSHATTKDYVDQSIAGLSWKSSVRVATTGNITLSGTQTIDGVAVVAGNRVLVKNQTTASQNGVYVVAAGAWTRASDFDSIAPIDEINSAAVFVQQGATLADTAWTQTLQVVTVGTDAMAFTQFAGVNTFFAGNGMSLTGNTFNVNTASTARIVVNTDDIDLAALSDAGTGSFVKITRDSYGRVAGTTPVTTADVTPLVDGTYVNVTGDTMSGALSIQSTSATPLIVRNTTASGISELSVASADRSFVLGQRSSTAPGGDLAYLYSGSSTPFAIYTNAAERFRIAVDGKVHIGGSSDGPADLNVRPNTTGSGSLSIAASAASGGGASYLIMGNSDSGGAPGPSMIIAANRVLQFGVGSSFSSRSGGTFTEHMRIDNGNVGIGTTSPTQKLHIEGTAPGAAVMARVKNNSSAAGLTYAVVSVQSDTLDGAITAWSSAGSRAGTFQIGTNTAHPVTFSTTDLERARITSAGELLVNRTTTSGLGQLQVAIATGNNIADFSNSSGSAGIVRIRTTTADSAYLMLQNSVSGTSLSDGLQLGIDSALQTYIINNENSPMVFQTNATERMRISGSGDVTVAGSFFAATKSFLIDHPSKPGMKLRYGSLESPYHGVRLTGEGVMMNGIATIQLPDYIKDLVKQDGAQVQVTNYRHGKVIWVDNIDVARGCFTVASETDDKVLGFFWSFTAIRKDVPDMIVEE